jgi:hypothetical protein
MKCRLASVNLKKKRIRLDPALKGRDRQRVKRHMTKFLERRLAGDSFTKAVKAANKAERGGMTMREWRRYNGRLGALSKRSKENR